MLASTGVVLLLLAIGVGGMQLLPGRPFSLAGPDAMPAPGGGGLGGGNSVSIDIIRVAFIGAALLLPIAIIYMLMTPDGRRRLLAYLVIIALVLVAYQLLKGSAQKPGTANLSGPLARGTPLPVATPRVTDVFVANTPDWLVIGISVAVALLLCGAAAAIAWMAWRRSHPPGGTGLEALAQEAQAAIDALQAGAELKDTVLRCYSEMSRVLRQERGLQRQAAMTAREFERALHDKGIPDEPIRQLTRLFEQVRYGREAPDTHAEQLAVSSLNAIVAACGPTPGSQRNPRP